MVKIEQLVVRYCMREGLQHYIKGRWKVALALVGMECLKNDRVKRDACKWTTKIGHSFVK